MLWKQQLNAHLMLKGNDQTVFEFFQHLQCRYGWLEILIEALQVDGLEDLARELQDVYNTNLPPSQRKAPLTASSPAVGNPPPPMRSGAVGFSSPASSERMASPPRDLSHREAQASPHLLPERQRAAPSIPNPSSAEMSSYHAPVQETDEAMAESKATHHPEILEFHAQALPFSVPAAERSPINAGAPSAPSPSHALLTQDHVLPGTSLPMPSEASASTQQWNSHQQRPVCVRNGYFGNAGLVAMDSGASPARADPLAHKLPGNQPVEDFYLSGPSSQDDSQEEERLREQNARAPSHSVKGNSNLQGQTDVGRGGATDRGRNSPTKKGDSESPVVVRPRNSQERGDHVATIATPQPISRVPQLGSSLSSRPLRPWRPSENVNVPPNPIAVPPSGFDEFSSTVAIPPSSHSSVQSRADFGDPKAPIQERKWSAGGDTDAPTLAQDKVSRVSQPLCTVNPRKRRNGSSCITRGNDDGDDDDDDDGPCKPGVLKSVPGTSSPGQLFNDPETVYSGRSERLCMSSLTEDPLILSDLSGPPGEQHSDSVLGAISGRNVMGERGDAPLQLSNADQEVGGSIRTYEVQVGKDASVDLTTAPNIIDPRRRQANRSSPDCPDLATDPSLITPANSHEGEASIPDDASPPRIPDDYKLPLVGLALVALAAIAFALYKRK
ncbi:mitochondrial antiviral-signaling protein isoform X2 [Anolis carolinensis]|uniref:mitochondrial antiviral-signaling protein isoform X2 n=1 Tax=Anolis carolinensis TaxID=28377 RepID=UPI002F2B4EC8